VQPVAEFGSSDRFTLVIGRMPASRSRQTADEISPRVRARHDADPLAAFKERDPGSPLTS
jgi:hypothetical protein